MVYALKEGNKLEVLEIDKTGIGFTVQVNKERLAYTDTFNLLAAILQKARQKSGEDAYTRMYVDAVFNQLE